MKGWNVVSIVTEDIRTPNGLAIDHKSQRLYWSDARLDKIERSDFDGKKREVCTINVYIIQRVLWVILFYYKNTENYFS